MAKKKTKSAPKTTKKASSHGQLFDSHPNLKWLLPVFFVIAAVAILVMKNNTDTSAPETVTTSIDQSTLNTTNTTINTTVNDTANSTNSNSGY